VGLTGVAGGGGVFSSHTRTGVRFPQLHSLLAPRTVKRAPLGLASASPGGKHNLGGLKWKIKKS